MFKSSKPCDFRCPKCGGEGRIITEHCHVCHGDKTSLGTDFLVVVIEKGIPDGHVYEYSQAGDEYLNVDPSDIHVEVNIIDHPVFSRKGDNLHTEITLTLKEVR